MKKLERGKLYKTIKENYTYEYTTVIDGTKFFNWETILFPKNSIMLYIGTKENYLKWLYNNKIFLTKNDFIYCIVEV